MQHAIKYNRPDLWTQPEAYMAWLLDYVARPDEGPKPTLPWVEDSFIVGPVPKRWHVIVTEPQKERTVEDDLKREKVDPFLPERKTFRRRSHRSAEKRILISRPLMPGYVFVAIEHARNAERVLRSCRHAIGYLRKGLAAAIIPPDEVQRIQNRVQAGDFDETVTHKKGWGKELTAGPYAWIDVGVYVRITDGPFASFHGLIEEVDAGRRIAKLGVEIFGRTTPMVHDFAQFEALC